MAHLDEYLAEEIRKNPHYNKYEFNDCSAIVVRNVVTSNNALCHDKIVFVLRKDGSVCSTAISTLSPKIAATNAVKECRNFGII